MCWFAHALIPDPRLVANAKPEQALPSKQETYRQAMIKTLLVLPLLLMFYLLKMTSDLLVLVFGRRPRSASGVRSARSSPTPSVVSPRWFVTTCSCSHRRR
jgi:hypothetical protein